MRNLIKKKKGSVIDIIVWMVMAFVIVVFFGLWVYGFHMVTGILGDVPSESSINVSYASELTFGQIDPAQTKGLQVLSYIMIISMALSILITNFLEKTHPAFFIVYLLVVVGAIIGSAYISNQYESLMQDANFGSTLSSFQGGSYIILYLPIWVTVIGLIGAVFLMAGILRDRDLGEGV